MVTTALVVAVIALGLVSVVLGGLAVFGFVAVSGFHDDVQKLRKENRRLQNELAGKWAEVMGAAKEDEAAIDSAEAANEERVLSAQDAEVERIMTDGQHG